MSGTIKSILGRGGFVVLASVLVLCATTVTPVGAVTTGSISGVVSYNGTGQSGVCIEAALTSGGLATSATTASDGTYTISNLNAGNYNVWEIATCGGSPTYANSSILTPATVTSGATTANVNFALVLAGAISGNVTYNDVGVASACVSAATPGQQISTAAVTASNGTYDDVGLAAGVYQLSVDPSCGGTISTTYNTQLLTSITVVAGATTPNENVQLTSSGASDPASPTIVSVSGENGAAGLAWTPPNNTGNSAIIGFTVTATDTTTSVTTTDACPSSTTTVAPNCTIPGLTNGDVYTFQVAAINAVGTGTFSIPSSPVTPTASGNSGGGASTLQFGTTAVLSEPKISGGVFRSISCPSVTTCVAVGFNPSGAMYATATLSAGIWAWSPIATIPYDNEPGGSLLGVSCATATSCVAVGSDGWPSPAFTFGTESGGEWTWTPLATIQLSGASGMTLESVSCPTATSCVAVGENSSGIENYTVGTESGSTWNWTPATILDPNQFLDASVRSISCPSATMCVAVGVDQDSPVAFYGTNSGGTWTWSARTIVSVDGSVYGGLEAVTCASTSACEIVGAGDNGDAYFISGTASGGGFNWISQAAAYPTGDNSLDMFAVSCLSATSCVSVGWDNQMREVEAQGSETGGIWTWSTPAVVASDSSGGGELLGVKCVSSSTCVAVGFDNATPNVAVYSTSTSVGISVPSAPSITSVTAGNALVNVNWTAPSNNGGRSITGYTVSALNTTTSTTINDACPSADSSVAANCTVSGLTNGDSYTFTVAAINEAGTGAFSSTSSSVTPASSGGGGGGGGVTTTTSTTTTTTPTTTTTTTIPTTTTTTKPGKVVSTAPKSVTLNIKTSSSGLSKGDRVVLNRFSEKLKRGSTITVVVNAKGNLASARKRAMLVANFVMSLVKVHVIVDLRSNVAGNSLTVKSP